MVILVDEYGGTAGLITQFDIVRFLAVDLPDEGDAGDRHLVQWDGTSPLPINGLVPMSEVVESLGIDAVPLGLRRERDPDDRLVGLPVTRRGDIDLHSRTDVLNNVD